MATLQETKNQLWRIGRVMPTYLGLMQRKATGSKTVGEVWATMLLDFDIARIEEVVDDICEGHIRPYDIDETADRLPFTILHQLRDRRDRDRRQWEQHVKYHTKPGDVMAAVKNDRAGRIAVALGKMVKAGLLSLEENEQRMNELMAWDAGRSVTPSWIEEAAEHAT